MTASHEQLKARIAELESALNAADEAAIQMGRDYDRLSAQNTRYLSALLDIVNSQGVPHADWYVQIASDALGVYE
jgi:hypothetical protein